MQIEYPESRSTYRAGACNIGPDEIERRRRSARFGFAMAAAIAICLLLVGAEPWLRVLVFLPLAGGIVGFEQARRHFCAGFALAGVRNFGHLGEQERVADAAANAADRRAALVLFGYSAAIAAVITLAFVLLPV